jgi:MFS family permease
MGNPAVTAAIGAGFGAGWPMVGGALLAQLFMIGFYSYSFSFLVLPLQEEFDASRTQVMYSMTASTLVSFLISPLAGVMVDRRSPRLLMAAGALVYGGGLLALSLMGSIWAFVALFALIMAVANSFLGPLLINPVLARRFEASRGRALGIAALGQSIGGFLVPPLFVFLLEQFGWRVSLQCYGVAVLLGLLPVLLLSVRDVSAAVPVASGAPAVSGPAPTQGFREILLRREYWLIGVPVGVLFSVISAVLANFSPYVASAGLTRSDAGTLLMAVPVAGIVGKLAFGYAADKLSKKLLLLVAVALMFTGVCLLALMPSYALIMLAVFCLGLASGATVPVWGALLPQVFGLASYGRVMGAMMPLTTVLVTAGFAVSGLTFDATGSYVALLALFAVMLVLAGLLLALLRLPAARTA